MKKPLVLGVDIGGSHITAALVDLERREILQTSYNRSILDAQAGANDILNIFCEVINNSFKGSNYTEKKICMAMPGPFDYVNGVSLIKEQEKFSSLYQINVKSELAKRLSIPESQIQFINDAASFLQGEVFAGSAKNSKTVMGLTLGTGLGSAFYINGISSDAALWNSGFLNGIAEDYLSTRWFVKRYYELSGRNINGVRDLAAGGFEKPLIDQIFKEFGSNLARFIVPFAEQHNFQTIIIGGNISLAFDSFSEEITSVLKSKKIQASVRVSTLNELATLIGAASCFADHIEISTN